MPSLGYSQTLSETESIEKIGKYESEKDFKINIINKNKKKRGIRKADTIEKDE